MNKKLKIWYQRKKKDRKKVSKQASLILFPSEQKLTRWSTVWSADSLTCVSLLKEWPIALARSQTCPYKDASAGHGVEVGVRFGVSDSSLLCGCCVSLWSSTILVVRGARWPLCSAGGWRGGNSQVLLFRGPSRKSVRFHQITVLNLSAPGCQHAWYHSSPGFNCWLVVGIQNSKY